MQQNIARTHMIKNNTIHNNKQQQQQQQQQQQIASQRCTAFLARYEMHLGQTQHAQDS